MNLENGWKPFSFLSGSLLAAAAGSPLLPLKSLPTVHPFNQLPCPKAAFKGLWVTSCFSINKAPVVLSVECVLKQL